MQSARLIVKNFGPLKDVDIIVNDFLCLIGQQATGKSTIAKLISIFEDENFRSNKELKLKDELEKYGMLDFLNQKTSINYYKGFLKEDKNIGTNFHFEYDTHKEIKLNFLDLFKDKIKHLYTENRNKNKKEIGELVSSFISIHLIASNKWLPNTEQFFISMDSALEDPITETDLNQAFQIIEEAFEKKGVSVKYDSQYIPSERNFLHIIAENTLGLINNKIQIPFHLLEIGQEYEKALNVVKEIPLNLITKKYKYIREGKISYIYHDDKEKVDLLKSASGMQSIVPIILLVEYAKTLKDNYHFNYVIEEPELNIYPSTQYNLIKYLAKNIFDSKSSYQRKKIVITTHSPYVLASANNLLLAYQKGQEKPKEVSKIINKSSWINPKNFNAYELKNGKSYSIYNSKLGQVKGNIIDKVSDEFSDEFDKLLAL